MFSRSLPVPSAVLAAAGAAVALNLAQFATIEDAAIYGYEAVRIKGGHDLPSLAEVHRGTQEIFALYVRLGDLTPQATIVVPPATPLAEERLLGLGRAIAVVRPDFDPTVDAAVASQLDAFVVAEGVNRSIGPYGIALGDRPADQLVLVEGPDRTYLADRALLEQIGAEVAP